jgi:predicted nucleic acid-binding protein
VGLTYLDSSVIIHAADDSEGGSRVRELLAGDSKNKFLISPLVRMESLVRPTRDNDAFRIRAREHVLGEFAQCQIKARTFELATHIRARHGLSTADAIHIAAANLSDCDAVWTTDKKLARRLPNFAVDILTSN